MSRLQPLTDRIIAFRDARDWKRFHNPKDLADELADVLYYTLLMSHELGIDLEQALLAKLGKNAERYPVGKAKGSNRKYTEL